MVIMSMRSEQDKVYAEEILDLVDPDAEVVGIDEAQFFDRNLIGVANRLANRGMRVVIAGLDQDYRGRPFAPMPDLMAIAEDVTKVRAVCTVCGNTASRSQRLLPEGSTVLVGGADKYEARCRGCFHSRDVAPAAVSAPA